MALQKIPSVYTVFKHSIEQVGTHYHFLRGQVNEVAVIPCNYIQGNRNVIKELSKEKKLE